MPTAPGVPRGIDTTEDSITIGWTKPRSDGGAIISGYVIERKMKGEDKWIRAVHGLVPDLTHRYKQIIEIEIFDIY